MSDNKQLKKLKIVLINSEYLHKVGGVEKVLEGLDQYLSNRAEIELKIINTANYDNVKSVGIKKIIDISLLELNSLFSSINTDKKVYSVWFGKSNSIKALLTPFRFFINYSLLKKIIDAINPDVINYHFVDDSVYLMSKISKNKKFKLITNIHGNDIEKFALNNSHYQSMKVVLKNSDRIVCNSDYIKKIIHKKFPEIESSKIKLIPNGIDANFIKNVMPLRFTESHYVFYVGRLVHKKGVDVLINAMKHLDADLLIEGAGEESEKLKQLTKELNIENKIHFTDAKLNLLEKIAYMKGADAIAIPSRIEPFGIVALEALASGVPLVSTNAGGMKEFLKNDTNALIFESENSLELAQKLNNVIHNKSLKSKLVKGALKTVDEYDLVKIHSQYLKLYKDE